MKWLPKSSIVKSKKVSEFKTSKLKKNSEIERLYNKREQKKCEIIERERKSKRVRISFPKEVENFIGSLFGPTVMYENKNIKLCYVNKKTYKNENNRFLREKT
ncbi:hypothetical protein BpHYR1_004486 [Brachionus plicatilis]|uniref:Uncharacterized protein n=1 Tax=Brachionus plicatilis TaxID=10195 RepID=A0A3M7S9H7_BRAPC|nr:hypothetical protein BpHYR1_004486 [Brachionus plicatilis]